MAGAKRGLEDGAGGPDVKRQMLEKALEAVKAKARSAVGRAQAVGQLHGKPGAVAQPSATAPALAVPSTSTPTAAPTAAMTLQQSVQARLAKMRQQGMISGTESPLPTQTHGVQPGLQAQMVAKVTAADRLQMLKERVGQKVQQTMAEGPTSRNVTMTADGRFIDAVTGEEVEVKRREAVLSVNKRHEHGTDTPLPDQVAVDTDDAPEEVIMDDSAVRLKSAHRKSRKVQFRDRGFHMEYAQRMRKRAEMEQLEQQIRERSARVLEETGPSSTLLITCKPALKVRGVPTIEWWDGIVLPTHKDMEGLKDGMDFPIITNLIEHPIPTQPHKPNSTKQIPVMLTKKEREKERRVRRREEHIEKQERIRLQLEPAPAPKLRLSNLMRILADEAVQDPTKMEAEVRRQVSERKEKHTKANAERKLTKEERSAKKDKKLTEDTKYEVYTAAFWVKDLSHPLNKRKLDQNALQFKLTGAVVMSPAGNLVVVEGGPKNIEKYSRLMMHRIKWNLGTRHDDYDIDYDEDDDDLADQKLVEQVWKGSSKAPRFTKWFFRKCSSEDEARRWLREYEAENLWDLILNAGALAKQGE